METKSINKSKEKVNWIDNEKYLKNFIKAFVDMKYEPRERIEKIKILIKNKNFCNSQNYVLWKKIKDNFFSSKNIRENGKNMIWFSFYKKIQEIDINLLKTKRKNLLFMIFGGVFLFFIVLFYDFFQEWLNKDNFQVLLFWVIFFTFFIPFWFLKPWTKNFLLFRDKNSLIVINKKL